MNRILLIEDGDVIKKVLEACMLRKGKDIDIVQAKDINSALHLLNEDNIHLIIINNRLRNIQGYQVAQELRQKGVSKRTPMLLLLDAFKEADKEKFTISGATDYILKPFSFTKFTSTIDSLINMAGINPTTEKSLIRSGEEKKGPAEQDHSVADKNLKKDNDARHEVTGNDSDAFPEMDNKRSGDNLFNDENDDDGESIINKISNEFKNILKAESEKTKKEPDKEPDQDKVSLLKLRKALSSKNKPDRTIHDKSGIKNNERLPGQESQSLKSNSPKKDMHKERHIPASAELREKIQEGDSISTTCIAPSADNELSNEECLDADRGARPTGDTPDAPIKEEDEEITGKGQDSGLKDNAQTQTKYKDIGNKRFESLVFADIGFSYKSLGQNKMALEHYKKALKIYQEIKDKKGEGDVLVKIGNAFSSLGQYHNALEYLEKAYRIHEEIGNEEGKGNALACTGTVYDALRQYKNALQCFQKALRQFRRIRNRESEIAMRMSIGDILFSLNRHRRAIMHYMKAFRISKKLGYRNSKADALTNIGIVYKYTGNNHKSLENYEKALGIYKEIGNKTGESNVLGKLGHVYSSLGQYLTALEYYEKTLRSLEEIGNKAEKARTLINIGHVHSSLGQYQKTLEYFEKALKIYRDLGFENEESCILHDIQLIQSSNAQNKNTLGFNEKSLETRSMIGTTHKNK